MPAWPAHGACRIFLLNFLIPFGLSGNIPDRPKTRFFIWSTRCFGVGLLPMALLVQTCKWYRSGGTRFAYSEHTKKQNKKNAVGPRNGTDKHSDLTWTISGFIYVSHIVRGWVLCSYVSLWGPIPCLCAEQKKREVADQRGRKHLTNRFSCLTSSLSNLLSRFQRHGADAISMEAMETKITKGVKENNKSRLYGSRGMNSLNLKRPYNLELSWFMWSIPAFLLLIQLAPVLPYAALSDFTTFWGCRVTRETLLGNFGKVNFPHTILSHVSSSHDERDEHEIWWFPKYGKKIIRKAFQLSQQRRIFDSSAENLNRSCNWLRCQ